MSDGGRQPSQSRHAVPGAVLGFAPFLFRDALKGVDVADDPGLRHHQRRHRNPEDASRSARVLISDLAPAVRPLTGKSLLIRQGRKSIELEGQSRQGVRDPLTLHFFGLPAEDLDARGVHLLDNTVEVRADQTAAHALDDVLIDGMQARDLARPAAQLGAVRRSVSER